ncbi:MAG: c-type cytochrome [bacterium]|nr:c-type cytochrome [bacterium]
MKKILMILVTVAVVLYVAYQAILYYDDNFKYGRMRETPAVRPYETPLLVMEAGVVPFLGGEPNYRAARPDDLKSPLPMNADETVKFGKTVYLTYCAQCHGKYYDGNGTVGQSFHPLPSDLRSTKVQTQSEGTLFQEISYGQPGGRQPALATTVSVQERWQVIAYIKSLGIRP